MMNQSVDFGETDASLDINISETHLSRHNMTSLNNSADDALLGRNLRAVAQLTTPHKLMLPQS